MQAEYIATGTLRVCPYSDTVSIVTTFEKDVDKSKCIHSKECNLEHCPLEEIAKSI